MAEEITNMKRISFWQNLDKESLPMLLLILTMTCIVGTLGLAITFNITKDIIKETMENEKIESMRTVLPPFDGTLVEKAVTVDDGQNQLYYVAQKKGKAIGVATVCTGGGYGGPIEVMVGILPDNSIYGVKLLRHQETPGLGAKASNIDFCSQFEGKKLNTSEQKLSVVKAGEKASDQNLAINAITAATITSAAFTKAVNKALIIFMENKKELVGNS